VFSDAPRELAELAVQHRGIARRVELVERPPVGDEIVESRAQLLGLE
jgi:hypothetical protein